MVVLAMEQLNPVCVGVDVGKLQDPAALAIAEIVQVHTGQYHYQRKAPEPAHIGPRGEWIPMKGPDPVMRSHYTIRYITRLTLGMSYPDMARYLADLLSNERFARRRVRTFLDATGVGQGVYDMLRAEIKLRKETQHIRLFPITFVSGEKYNPKTGSLGKEYLVSRLQALLQNGRVHGPKTPEMEATVEELRVYEARINQDGHAQYGAFKTGKHDDLATALALACLTDPWRERITYSERVF